MKQLTDNEKDQLGLIWGNILDLNYEGDDWVIDNGRKVSNIALYYILHDLIYNRYERVRGKQK